MKKPKVFCHGCGNWLEKEHAQGWVKQFAYDPETRGGYALDEAGDRIVRKVRWKCIEPGDEVSAMNEDSTK